MTRHSLQSYHTQSKVARSEGALPSLILRTTKSLDYSKVKLDTEHIPKEELVPFCEDVEIEAQEVMDEEQGNWFLLQHITDTI